MNDGTCTSGGGFTHFVSPNHWNVLQGQEVHLNISAPSLCTAGVNIGAPCSASCSSRTCNRANHKCSNQPSRACTTDVDCTIAGTCTQQSLECSGSTNVFVKGHDSTACSAGGGTCTNGGV